MTIQEAAQKTLLIFYERYKNTGIITDDTFEFRNDGAWELDTDDENLKKALLDEVGSAILLKVAIQYLEDKSLISFKTHGLLSGDFIAHQFTLTSVGVDMVEGIGGAGNSRDVYQNTFNVVLNNDITVDSFIKTELKASVLSLLQ
jgi:hypothetical protein